MTSGHPLSSIRARVAGAFFLILNALWGLMPGPASAAPLGFQASVGWNPDFLVGFGARLGLGSITIIPNVESEIGGSNGFRYYLNLDGTMSVLPLGVANGYLGAGIGLAGHSESGNSNDTVINVIAGAGLNAVPYKPFAQFKWVMADGDDPVVFSIGARF